MTHTHCGHQDPCCRCHGEDRCIRITYVSPEAFDELLADLERPPEEVPGLTELFKRPRRFRRKDADDD